MSSLTPSMPFVANAAPAASASAPAGNAEGGQGDAFARCLDHARKTDTPDAPDADAAPQRPGAKKTASNTKTDRSARDAGRADAKTDTPTKSKGDAETGADAQASAAHSDGHDDTGTPDLAALLPGWTPLAAAPTAATPGTVAALPVSTADTATAATPGDDDGDLADVCSSVASAKVSATAARDESAARVRAPLAAAPSATAANANAAQSEAASSAALQSTASEQRRAAADPSTAPLSMTLPSAPVATATTTLVAAPQKVTEAQPTATAMVPAPIDSPAFAPALATQLRWWASDGVQQAQLLLNPPEMGPVAVKILLAGNEARIDFSADLAATRNAIEAALPVLAAALDESGLKLTGGGVHDGSAQQQPQWREHSVTDRTGRRGSAAVDDPRAQSAPGSRAPSGRGIVDLVA